MVNRAPVTVEGIGQESGMDAVGSHLLPAIDTIVVEPLEGGIGGYTCIHHKDGIAAFTDGCTSRLLDDLRILFHGEGHAVGDLRTGSQYPETITLYA